MDNSLSRPSLCGCEAVGRFGRRRTRIEHVFQLRQFLELSIGILAHDARGVSSSWVEVSQQGTIPFFARTVHLFRSCQISGNPVGYDCFHHGLRVAVGVGRSDRTFLGNGYHVGNRVTSPYTVADDEKTMFVPPCCSMVVSKRTAPNTFVW